MLGLTGLLRIARLRRLTWILRNAGRTGQRNLPWILRRLSGLRWVLVGLARNRLVRVVRRRLLGSAADDPVARPAQSHVQAWIDGLAVCVQLLAARILLVARLIVLRARVAGSRLRATRLGIARL